MNSEALLITAEYVFQALDALTHRVFNVEFNPLQSLQIVENRLFSADFTFFAFPRHYALNEILISIIEDQYLHHRNVYELSDPRINFSISELKILIAQDALTQNADLIGWSWLYFHYVKTDIHIAQHEYSKLANLDNRTIRRYQSRAIDQLTASLIKLEQDARHKHFKERLFTQLPHKGKELVVFGREQSTRQIQQNQKRHFHVIGASGIGKSTFVEYIVREKISQGEIEQLIWLDTIPNLEFLHAYLYEQLIGEYSTYTLEAYMSLKRVTIVLDNCESLFQDTVLLQQLLEMLNNAQIFLITTSFDRSIIEFEPIILRELTLPAIEMLVEQVSRANDDIEIVETVTDIRNSVGGNPLAIKAFLQYRSLYSAAISNQFTVAELYADRFSSLTLSTQFAWLLISLNYDSQLKLTHLSDLALSNLNFQDFVILIQLHILEDRLGHLSMNVSARHYIRLRYLVDSNLQQLLADLLKDAGSLFYKSEHLCLLLMESVLSTDWLILDLEQKSKIAKLLWRVGIGLGHYAQWNLILSEYENTVSEKNLNLLIGYGICLRRLGRLEHSYRVFTLIIEYCGLNGFFEDQCEALLEICILSRYTSNYENAFNFLNHAKILSKKLKTRSLNERVSLEEVEFAVETYKWELALAKLFDLPDYHPRKAILELEISVNMDKEIASNSQIDLRMASFLEQAKEHGPSVVQIHVLIGRIYEKRNQLQLATRHFMSALALLEQYDNDPFALARTQTNLAAVLLVSNNLDGVSDLLKAAERTQRIIGDQVGLIATLHNNTVLARKIVS